jgi:hypothetical protein
MERRVTSVWEDGFMADSWRASENLFLAAQIPGGPQVGDAEHRHVLIFVADRAKRKSPHFEADAAARPVVADLLRAGFERPAASSRNSLRRPRSIRGGSYRHSPCSARHLVGSLLRNSEGLATGFTGRFTVEKCATVTNDSLYGLSFSRVPIAVSRLRDGIVIYDEFRVVVLPRLHGHSRSRAARSAAPCRRTRMA